MIDIIFVNWNAGKLLQEAVSSIMDYHNNLVGKVIIVDNASTDTSLEQVEALSPLPFELKIIRNHDNRGFGAACNQGAAECTSEFILLLNPDARLYQDSLPTAYHYLHDHSDVGVCGIQLVEEGNVIQRTCARFPTPKMLIIHSLGLNRLPFIDAKSYHMGDWDHQDTREVDHVIGAFYLIRRSLFEQLKGFDEERFFVYLEDLDLSYRVKQAGYKIVYLTEAQAFHEGGGTSSQVKATRLFYSLRSRMLYAFKHFSKPAAWGVFLTTMIWEPVIRILFALLKGKTSDAKNTVAGYKMLWQHATDILQGKGK